MRLTTSQTPVIQGPSNGGAISFKSVLGQGATGPQGPPGLPGVNAVATDTAVATYASTPGTATATALSASYAGISDPAGNPLTGKRVRLVFLNGDLDDIVMEDN